MYGGVDAPSPTPPYAYTISSRYSRGALLGGEPLVFAPNRPSPRPEYRLRPELGALPAQQLSSALLALEQRRHQRGSTVLSRRVNGCACLQKI